MLPLEATQSSCWTRVKDYLRSERTISTAKIVFWSAGSMGAISIPVPFLNQAASAAMLFMATQEILKHPDSALMQDEAFQRIASTRKWKHLSLGAAISAVGGGLTDLILASKVAAIFPFPVLGSIAIGLKVTYSPTLFTTEASTQTTASPEFPEQDQLLSS